MKIKQLTKKIFSKTEKSVVKPMGVITTVQRPEQAVNRLSDEQRKKMNDEFIKNKEAEQKLSPYFIQEISDRLYGPDSDEYIKAINQLNSKFKPRNGRTGPQIYRDEI
jgi:hypothetical protein